MRVQITQALIGEVSFQRGQIVDLPDRTAADYIRCGHAIPVIDEPELANSKTIVEKRNGNTEKGSNPGK